MIYSLKQKSFIEIHPLNASMTHRIYLVILQIKLKLFPLCNKSERPLGMHQTIKQNCSFPKQIIEVIKSPQKDCSQLSVPWDNFSRHFSKTKASISYRSVACLNGMFVGNRNLFEVMLWQHKKTSQCEWISGNCKA